MTGSLYREVVTHPEPEYPREYYKEPPYNTKNTLFYTPLPRNEWHGKMSKSVHSELHRFPRQGVCFHSPLRGLGFAPSQK